MTFLHACETCGHKQCSSNGHKRSSNGDVPPVFCVTPERRLGGKHAKKDARSKPNNHSLSFHRKPHSCILIRSPLSFRLHAACQRHSKRKPGEWAPDVRICKKLKMAPKMARPRSPPSQIMISARLSPRRATQWHPSLHAKPKSSHLKRIQACLLCVCVRVRRCVCVWSVVEI